MGRIDTRLKHFLVRRTPRPHSQMAHSGEHIRDAVGTRDDISLSARDRDKKPLVPRACHSSLCLSHFNIKHDTTSGGGHMATLQLVCGGADKRTELQMKRNEK